MPSVSSHDLVWPGLSGINTTLSWIFYYKALKASDMATVALIDKGSVVVPMRLTCIVLRKIITLRRIVGAALIVAGRLAIAWK